MRDSEDAQIIRRSLSGEPSAFSGLFWLHGASVHAYVARRTGRDVADDLVSEVWLRAFRSRETFDQHASSALPWLYGIARNVLRESWRQRSKPLPDLPVAVLDPWIDVEDQLDGRARHRELKDALAQLSEVERESLLLVAWEQLSASEIADILHVPASTIRNRLHRARQVMRQQLDAPTNATPEPE